LTSLRPPRVQSIELRETNIQDQPATE
jgi:hypothetical protein